MKKTIKQTALIAATVLLGACTGQNSKIHCHIEGTVADSTYTMMLLTPSCNDMRTTPPDSIPVIDGRFSYDLYTDEIMPYELVAMEQYNSGIWYTAEFFAEQGEVAITFYAGADDKIPTISSVTPSNSNYMRLQSSLDSMTAQIEHEEDSLKRIGRWETPKMIELHAQFNAAKDYQTKKEIAQQANALYESGEAYTPEYHALQAKSDKVYEEYEKYIFDFIRNDRGIVGLHMLQRKTMYKEVDEALCTTLFNEIYRERYLNHPLGQYMETWVQSLGIKVGGRYIDFTAPDLNGTPHTLSREIAGKIALIDLWASWCSPCRRTSKSMIPIYNAYKERGFTIVGIARENKREDMQQAITKDGYPWLNLIELLDENNIWSKYGVNNAGGITVLVDRDGTILAIKPTADEVEHILKEKLQ